MAVVLFVVVVLVVAAAVVVVAVWRCWCYLGVCMRVCIGGTRTWPGPWLLALCLALYRFLFHRYPSIHRDYQPLCRSHGGHRTESDRARPATHQDGCVSLTRARLTRRGKDYPGINGTCCLAIVGPVPEQRDTGQEARGMFFLPYLLSCPLEISLVRVLRGALFPFRDSFHPISTPLAPRKPTTPPANFSQGSCG